MKKEKLGPRNEEVLRDDVLQRSPSPLYEWKCSSVRNVRKESIDNLRLFLTKCSLANVKQKIKLLQSLDL